MMWRSGEFPTHLGLLDKELERKDLETDLGRHIEFVIVRDYA